MIILFPALLAAVQAPAIRARTIGAQSAVSQGQQAQSQDSILKRAQQLIGQGNLEGARAELVQGLKSFPHEAAIYNFLGVVDAQENNLQVAEEHFRQAIALDPRYAGACLNLGHLYQSEIPKVPDAASLALATYLKLLRYDPANAEANYQAAVLEMRKGDYQGSLGHLRKLSAADQQKPQALAVLCADLAGAGHLSEASSAASRLAASAELKEDDVISILPYLKSHNPLALQLLATVVRRNLASESTLYKLAQLQEQAGQLKQARQTFESVAEKEPNQAVPLIDLARIANVQHDYRGALGYLAHARDLEPENAAVHFFFGIVCIEMDLHQEAYVSLKKAVNLDPDNAYYNYAFGAVASQRDDPREAIPYFKKYCALRPSDPRGPLSLGAAYYYSHDLEVSRNELLKVARVKATAAGANYFLGRIAYDDDNLPDAAQYLTTATRDDPEYADAYAALGGVYLNQKKYGHAEESLLRALKIDPTNYLANLNLTVLYQRTKDKRAAEQAKRFAALRTQREQRAKLFLRTIRVVP
ncbi:MAG TPA: tetratricopeptide repeat protein [Terriglobia bacterium]|nr:tetratricopeptide repeat protein [Terriglobia bacterium]